MATREQVAFFRAARAGDTDAQLELGKRYLFGTAGLEQNITSSLYWLHRAANRGAAEAWLLIGAHIPYEAALRAPDPMQLCVWYEKAFEAGIGEAGLVWARLVLKASEHAPDRPLRRRALQALERAAAAGVRDAQWLLAQEIRRIAQRAAHAEGTGNARPVAISYRMVEQAELEWTSRAAQNGVQGAQRALMDRAWEAQDYRAFLRWALPAARPHLHARKTSRHAAQLSESDVVLLSRCAHAMLKTDDTNTEEIEQLLLLAATGGDLEAQYLLGLYYGNLGEDGGRRVRPLRKTSNKRAIEWLNLAAARGHVRAAFCLYMLHAKQTAGAGQHALPQLESWLITAANGGLDLAQLELGKRLWRARQETVENGVQAIHWLQRAVAQGNSMARQMLLSIASRPAPAAWAQEAQQRITREIAAAQPWLAARIELAARFGLSRKEALALDVNLANRGHCLVVDLRPHYKRWQPRFIVMENPDDYVALADIASRFSAVDCGPGGPEGNLRRRLYLFNKLFATPRAAANASSATAAGGA